jgi:hypothetical protein
MVADTWPFLHALYAYSSDLFNVVRFLYSISELPFGDFTLATCILQIYEVLIKLPL